MRTLRFMLKKEFLQIKRNIFLLRMILIMPIIQLAILPWAATFEMKNIYLSVIDHDKSETSRRLVDKVTSSGYFIFTDYTTHYGTALKGMELGRSDIMLEIPHDFEKNLAIGQPATTLLTIDAVNGQKAGVGLSYISQIINTYSHELQGNGNNTPITLKPYYRYNTEMNYQNFMVPGIMVILVTLIGGMLSAMNIVREKEMGTMEQINVTPVSKTVFILGKLIPFWVIGLVLLTIGMCVAYAIYGLIPIGSVFTIYLFALLYLMAFTGLGLMVSNYSSTQQQAMFVIFFVLIICILLGGLFTPISSMTEWAQRFTIINPLRYFVEVMRLVYMKGSGVAEIMPHIARISCFVVVFNLLAIISYRKKTG